MSTTVTAAEAGHAPTATHDTPGHRAPARIRPPRWWALVVLALLCARIAAHAGPALRPADPAIAALIHRLEALRVAHSVPAVGLALATARRTLWAGAWGIAERAGSRPAGRDTRFRIGSITKTFTALAVLKAVEQGRLRLDQPVRAVAPDLPLVNPWAPRRPVRLAHLLEHTAGLEDLTREEFSYPRPLPLHEALALGADHRVVRWPPGWYAQYGNAAAGLTAAVLERATGSRYEEYLTRHVLAPLGMHDSGFVTDEAAPAVRLAAGYDRDGRSPIPYWHVLFRAFGGLDTSPADMARLVRMLLARGRIDERRVFTRRSIARMERPLTSLAARCGIDTGRAPGIETWFRDGHRLRGHGGDADGYLAHFGYSRASGRGYFLVINAFDAEALAEMRARVERYVLAGLAPPPPPPAARLEPALVRAIPGRLEPLTRRFAWQPPPAASCATADPQGVTLRYPDGHRQRLIAVDGHRLRAVDEPSASSVVCRGPDGRLVLTGAVGNHWLTGAPCADRATGE